MSIVITSATTARSLPGLPGDSSALSDSTAEMGDFASLLFGSLNTGITAIGGLLTESSASASNEKSSERTPGAEDSALFLASLGFVPLQAIDGKGENKPTSILNGELSSPTASAIQPEQIIGKITPPTDASSQPPGASEASLAGAFAEIAAAALAGQSPKLKALSDDSDKAAKIAVSDQFAAKAAPEVSPRETLTGNVPANAAANTSANATAQSLADTVFRVKRENAGDDPPMLNTSQLATNPATHTSGVEATQKSAHATQNTAWSPKVDTPLRDPAWSSDFSQKIVWMASNDKQAAQITLNPPQLGPIDISLNISKDTATALFVSANPEVRESIEAALPRLREMLAGAGIELGQANVSEQSPRQQAEQESGRPGAPRWQNDNAILVADSGIRMNDRIQQRGSGMVDIFA